MLSGTPVKWDTIFVGPKSLTSKKLVVFASKTFRPIRLPRPSLSWQQARSKLSHGRSARFESTLRQHRLNNRNNWACLASKHRPVFSENVEQRRQEVRRFVALSDADVKNYDDAPKFKSNLRQRRLHDRAPVLPNTGQRRWLKNRAITMDSTTFCCATDAGPKSYDNNATTH